MKQISYVGFRMLTSDTVASAIMGYARSLATTGTADVVTIPVLDGSGAPCTAELLVGPASGLLCVSVPDPATSLQGDEEATTELLRRGRACMPPLSEFFAAYEKSADR